MTVQELISEAFQALAENARYARDFNIKGVRLTVQGEGEVGKDPDNVAGLVWSNMAYNLLDLNRREGKDREVHLEVLDE